MTCFFFVERTNIVNFADNNTTYRYDSEVGIVLEYLRYGLKVLLNGLNINSLKPNPPKNSIYDSW